MGQYASGLEDTHTDTAGRMVETYASLGLAHFLKNASVPSTVFCNSGNWVAIPRM